MALHKNRELEPDGPCGSFTHSKKPDRELEPEQVRGLENRIEAGLPEWPAPPDL